MDTVLVTGGAGFVGSSLAIALKERGVKRVVVLDNLKRRGSELNLARLKAHDVVFFHGDVRNPEDLEDVGGADCILECSAEPSVLAGYGNSPCNVVQTNLTGMLHCLEWARRCCAAIIFFSTSRVYPIATINALPYEEHPTRFDLPHDFLGPGISYNGIGEGFSLEGTRSLYGATKLCGELMMREYLDAYGLKGCINRCGLIAGPWQMGKTDQGVVTLWAARHVYGGALSYIGFGGTGKQVRDMLHIDDLVRLVCLEMDQIEQLSGSLFNVGGGRVANASLLEMTELCVDITGNPIPISRQTETRPADIKWYITDNAHVTAATGWYPEKDVRAILTDIVRWIIDHKDALAPVLAAT